MKKNTHCFLSCPGNLYPPHFVRLSKVLGVIPSWMAACGHESDGRSPPHRYRCFSLLDLVGNVSISFGGVPAKAYDWLISLVAFSGTLDLTREGKVICSVDSMEPGLGSIDLYTAMTPPHFGKSPFHLPSQTSLWGTISVQP
jgi:hypothetical protein